MAYNWYVVQVLSSQEKKVKRTIEENCQTAGLEELVEEVLLPTENVSEVKKGERKVSEKRIWPGYLLIRMQLTDDTWSFVKETNGVINFLGGEKPCPLSDAEVETLLSDLASKKENITEKYHFQVGDAVKVTDGVFVNFTGVISEIFPDKGRVSVLVSIFGRETRVDDLEFWQVEEVTEGEVEAG